MAFMGGSDPDQQPNESPRASSANPERWVDEHGDYLYRYALVRVRVPELAEDLVQETLLAAVRSREKFGGRSFRAKLARRHPEKQNSRLLPQLGRVVDASVFPSSGAVNPALTVIANALRVGDHLLDRVN
jgi:Sigma-70 region 2